MSKPSVDAATLARWRQDIVFTENVLGDDYTFRSTWGIFSPKAKKCPQGTSVLLDKDFVAVDYARRNCEANGLKNTEVFLSNGFNQVGDRKFDIILSNLPAKVGNEQHYLYLYDALAHLKPGGKFYVVTINGLRDFISRTFKEVFGNYDKLKQGKTYTVAVAEKLQLKKHLLM